MLAVCRGASLTFPSLPIPFRGEQPKNSKFQWVLLVRVVTSYSRRRRMGTTFIRLLIKTDSVTPDCNFMLQPRACDLKSRILLGVLLYSLYGTMKTSLCQDVGRGVALGCLFYAPPYLIARLTFVFP